MATAPVDPAVGRPSGGLAPPSADSSAAGAHADARTRRGEPLLPGDPTTFEFFQAMRLLGRRLADREPVGGHGDPAREVVRLGVDAELGFPPSDIRSLEPVPDGPPRMAVTFLGLTGPNGVLPHEYTLQVAERMRARDRAMRDFLDIIHHRLLSLYYRAWEKHAFAIAYERDGHDHLTRHLLDLIGVGTAGLAERLDVPPESLLPYAGLLAPRPRPAIALAQMLEDYFDVPVVVEQFVGGWHAIAADAQCRLGDEDGEAAPLGRGAVVGDEIWEQQSRARIRIGPLARDRYDDFLPTGSAHAPLRALVRFFTSDEVDVDVQLVLARDDVPGLALGADDAPPLGWCTWLRTTPVLGRDPDDTTLPLADARMPT